MHIKDVMTKADLNVPIYQDKEFFSKLYKHLW